MSDAVVFGIVFAGFFVARAIAATVFFYYMMPESNRCPLCDQPTLRVSEPAWNRLLPWFRTSWCYECGWEGLLRPGPTEEPTSTETHAGQLPLNSK